MATITKNLSNYNRDTTPNAANMVFGIVVSEWNSEITNALLDGVVSTLKECGAKENRIIIKYVPGSFELPIGAQLLLDFANVDAVICLGCVIQGETKHFDYVCQGLTYGIQTVSLKYNKPVIFGVLTDNSFEQSKARAGGKFGNKGIEAAVSAIKMVHLYNELKS